MRFEKIGEDGDRVVVEFKNDSFLDEVFLRMTHFLRASGFEVGQVTEQDDAGSACGEG